MGYLFNFRGIVWGLFWIVAGIFIILVPFYHLNISLIRVFGALFIIFLGITILFGGFWSRRHWRGMRTVKYTAGSGDQNYKINFEGANIDLSDLVPGKDTVKVRIDCSFGGGTALVKPDVPLSIQAASSFGGVTFPDGTSVGFSSGKFESKNFNAAAGHLEIDVNVSFGGLRFITSADQTDDWEKWRESRHEWKRRFREERREWKRKFRNRD